MMQTGKKIAGRLLELVLLYSNGKHTVFAKKAGIPHGTFSAYIKGRVPHADHLCRIHDTYNININWLLTGEGEMTRTPEKEVEDEKDDIYIYKEELPETAGLLSMTREILISDTDYSVSLAANIRSFHHALKTESRLNGVDSNMLEMKNIIKNLASEIKDIKQSSKQIDKIRESDSEIKKGEILKKRAM